MLLYRGYSTALHRKAGVDHGARVVAQESAQTDGRRLGSPRSGLDHTARAFLFQGPAKKGFATSNVTRNTLVQSSRITTLATVNARTVASETADRIA